MKLPELTIIPAGAGSGKTYTIQTTLCDWVKNNLVAADRIVAVTFTEAAAAELKGRIRAELLKNGRLDDALKLEQAYISTIHGFGLRVISEFAFEAGMSPHPRLLNEDEEDVFIRRALAITDKADPVINNLYHYGYSYDFNSQKGAEELFRDDILALIGKLRSIGHLEEDPRLYPTAASKITELYGPTGVAAHLKRALLEAVRELLEKFPDNLASQFEGNKTAEAKFSGDCQTLKRAMTGDPLEREWKLWQKLRDLRKSKRGSPTPEGYDDLADAVMAAADALPLHPGPLRDALQHVEALLGASQEVLKKYGEQKREKGLVDYTDMLAIARQLLTGNPAVLTELRSRIGCLVIDEFQDTNPLQFSLLWALFEAGVPCLIVGDLKQAIMRFQYADSRLMGTLQEQHTGAVKPLKCNWRSSKPLMEWVNQVGEGLFGERYQKLTPKADFVSRISPLEAIEFTAAGTVSSRAGHTCLRLRALLDEGHEVWDKSHREYRPLRAGDIAILCPTNTRLANYAEVLNSLGIRARLAQQGWFESPIVRILYYALSYVADPGDIHAALYLAVTELGSLDLHDALQIVCRGEGQSQPLLDRLRDSQPELSILTIDSMMAKVIEILDLYGEVAFWPDGDQARADLLRFQGEAEGFLQANREALISGGYYGADLKTFLTWLRKRVEKDNGRADPRVIDKDAVQLMTWHKAKGREWPVVAVCGTERKVEARLPCFGVAYSDFSELQAILEKATLECSPQFAAPEQNEKFLERLWEETKGDALNLLYVALTRAREKLILECHHYQKEGNRSYWNILKEHCSIDFKANKMTVNGKSFDCRITATTKAPPTFAGEAEGMEDAQLLGLGRRALIAGVLPAGLSPEALSPSALHGNESGQRPEIETIAYGEPLKIELDLSPLERGTVLHRCFEITAFDQAHLAKIGSVTGCEFAAEQQEAIGGATSAFYQWLRDNLEPVAIEAEVPVLFADANGSVVAGEIDLLIETKAGLWIVDHKSDVTEDLFSRSLHYLPQLACYAEGVQRAKPDKPVLGLMINWISSGKISRISL